MLTKTLKMKKIIESVRDWGRDCYCDSGKDNTCMKRFGWQLGDLLQISINRGDSLVGRQPLQLRPPLLVRIGFRHLSSGMTVWKVLTRRTSFSLAERTIISS